jgi:hypothetical protein
LQHIKAYLSINKAIFNKWILTIWESFGTKVDSFGTNFNWLSISYRGVWEKCGHFWEKLGTFSMTF